MQSFYSEGGHRFVPRMGVCEGVLVIFHAVVMGPLSLHPCKVGAEHAGVIAGPGPRSVNKRAAPWRVRRLA